MSRMTSHRTFDTFHSCGQYRWVPRFQPGEWYGDHNRPSGAVARTVGRFRVGPDDRFDRHHHGGDEFWFIVEGAGRLRFGDETFDVSAGDIVLAPAGVSHDILSVEDVLAGFFAELTGDSGDAAPSGHLHATGEDAAGHPVGWTRKDRS